MINPNEMILIPIEADESLNERFRRIPECAEVLDIFVAGRRRWGGVGMGVS